MKQNILMILASGSPRRRKLLEQAGLEFEVVVSDVEEIKPNNKPIDVVLELSKQKSRAVADEFIRKTPKNLDNLINTETKAGGIIIIGADTVVAIDDTILGKPDSPDAAFNMLKMMSGRTHEVYTGVTCNVLTYNTYIEGLLEVDSFQFYEETQVNMYPFNEYEILDYISTGEPMDKAGSYGIQGIGSRLVRSIDGDYNNVVGFPLSRFIRELIDRDYLIFD